MLCLLLETHEVHANRTSGVLRSIWNLLIAAKKKSTVFQHPWRLTRLGDLCMQSSVVPSRIFHRVEGTLCHVPSAVCFLQGTGVQVCILTFEHEQWLQSNTWHLVLSYWILMPLAGRYTMDLLLISVNSYKTSPSLLVTNPEVTNAPNNAIW